MKIEEYSRPSVEDIESKYPEITRHLKAANEQIDKLSQLAQRRWAPDSNSNSEMIELDIAHDTEAEVRLRFLTGAPVEAYLGYTEGDEAASLVWSRGVQQDIVKIKVTWPDAPTEQRRVRIRFWGTD